MQHFLSSSRESLTKKASYLRIVSRVIANSLKSGTFKSLYRGQGVEINGVREYLYGDDIRTIDWNVTARMKKPFVKSFDEEHEMQIFLIIDRSTSMFTGSLGKIKYETAAETAAILTVAAEINDNPIGAVFFDGKIHRACEVESGKLQTMKILTILDEINMHTNGSALANAIKGAYKLLRKHSLIFIISDFRTTGFEEPFKLLAQKNDVCLVRITDPSEAELPAISSIPITDSETKERTYLPTNNSEFHSLWHEAYRNRTERLKKFCTRHGGSYVSISTREDVVRVLSNFLAAKESYIIGRKQK